MRPSPLCRLLSLLPHSLQLPHNNKQKQWQVLQSHKVHLVGRLEQVQDLVLLPVHRHKHKLAQLCYKQVYPLLHQA